MNKNKQIVLVQPDYPIPQKRKINHDFLPIGLLKIGSYLKNCKGYSIEIIFGNKELTFKPEEIWITSLFTYWSGYVHDSILYYQSQFPGAKIVVGGIYATLLPEHLTNKYDVEVFEGIHSEAENWCNENGIDYSILNKEIDFQIIHGMRGCFRKCKFCGTWKLEPKETFEREVAKRIVKNHVVFYDNNFLRNPYIKDILKELAEVRVNGKKVVYESQSGFDGRILNQEIANLLKKAGFRNPRIAWDNSLDDEKKIEDQVNMLINAGFPRKEIYVFMLYNWEYGYNDMESKRIKCWKWGVQISDCRYRPLDQLFDRYNSKRKQTNEDYYIHPKWTDEKIKLFRSNVRKHNICVRHGFPFYSKTMEHMKLSKEEIARLNKSPKKDVRKTLGDAWYPDDFHKPIEDQSRIEQYL